MQKQINLNSKSLMSIGLIAALLLDGCATTSTHKYNPADPWQGWNRGTQSFNDGFDRNILKPLATGYNKVTNDVVRDGVTNFYNNVDDVGTTVNDFMQLKFKQGGMDMSRFLINSTLGIAGFVDVASKLELPKHNEDFGQTLGFWGTPSGPYFVLPFFGPSSPRDTVGRVGDVFMNPLTYVSMFGSWFHTLATGGSSIVRVTNWRSNVMTKEKILNEAVVGDRYDFLKNSYQQQRESLIHDGTEPLDEEDVFGAELDSDSRPGATSNNNAGAKPGNVPTKPDKTGLPTVQNNSSHFLELATPNGK
jgi:phospholipid-binding lipoprotein MlaA